MRPQKRINSRRKGKRGELEAVKYLKSLGFLDARRSVQYKGTADSFDIECPKTLPDVRIECKFGIQNFSLGSAMFLLAMHKCKAQAEERTWCLLWKKQHGRSWYLTYESPNGVINTIFLDEDMKTVLLDLQKHAESIHSRRAV